jgi:hypothetical protein
LEKTSLGRQNVKLLGLGLLTLLVGCDDYVFGEARDADAVPVDTDWEAHEAFCSDAPLINYANFGAGFMVENCQPCHGTGSPNRYGAPEHVTFDTEEDCVFWQDRIIARSVGENVTMPPQGGVEEDDRYRLEVWMLCE